MAETEFTKINVRYIQKGDDVTHDIANEPLIDLNNNIDNLVEYTDNLYDQAAEVSQDLIGVPTRGTNTISFNDATREITFDATGTDFIVWDRGRSISLTNESIIIDDTSGGRYIIYDSSVGSLVDAGQYPGYSHILTHYVYWNATQGKFVIKGDERHTSARNTTWHLNKHIEDGMVWRRGGAATYTLNDPDNITIALGAPIVLSDEDLTHEVNHSSTPSGLFEQILEGTAEIPVIYVDETGYYAIDDATTEPYKMGTDKVAYNSISNSLGSQVDVPNGKYMNYFIIGTNCSDTPIKSIQGRHVYDSFEEAQGEVIEDFGLNLPETATLYQIVLHVMDNITANPYKVIIEGVLRPAKSLQGPSSTISAELHNSLGGRSEPNVHPATSVSINGISRYPSAETVQDVLNGLNDLSTWSETELENRIITFAVAL